MYLGIDFLFDESGKLYVSEVNTGLPGGAREYDLIQRIRFNRPSGIFNKIESISEEVYSKPFSSFIRELPYFNELKALKIWMDGKGSLPPGIPAMLRLEDKWIQYRLLADRFPLIYSELYDKDNESSYIEYIKKYGGIVLKRRLGRGGSGFKQAKSARLLRELTSREHPENFYIVQPLVKSRIKIKDRFFRLSIRSMVFAGRFVCMFANISPRITSNHGIRFDINPCDKFGIENEDFKVIEVTEKAWEADIFFGDDIPAHLYHNLYEEEISDSFLNLPDKIYTDIIKTSIAISSFYAALDSDDIPVCYLEEEAFKEFRGF